MASETILIIDDSQEIRELLTKYILGPAGYHVLYAYDGNNGIQKAIQSQPDLILLDVNMPGKSGLDVLKELNQAGYSFPSIVMTSYGSAEAILQSFRLGAKDFLQKPFGAEEALSAVTKSLAESRWQKERAQVRHDLEQANHQLQKQIKAWANLYAIGQAITSTLDETDVQRRLMWGINQLMHVQAGSLYLLDEQKGELVLQISLGGEMEKKGGLRLQMGQGIAGWVAQNNKAALVPDVHSDPRFFSQVDAKTGFLTLSVLAVPLTSKGKIVGVIQVMNPTGDKKHFDKTDQELLESLASFVAVAVDNARLHARMQQVITLETLKQTVATLSHYINNSLTVLTMIADAMRNGMLSQKPDRTHDAAAKIETETRRIAAVISVLKRLISPRKRIYEGETSLIDIDTELRQVLLETR